MINAFNEWRARSPSLAALVLLHVALAAVLLCALSLDSAAVLGIDRWIKPLKFSVSIAIYLATVGWLLPATGVTGRTRSGLVAVVGATMAIEMIAITVQSARGTTSHFNIATPFDASVFQVMGIAILLNTLANVWLGIGAIRVAINDGSSYHVGVAAGFVVFLLGSAVGPVMISHNAHTVGAVDGGPGLPLVNWSTIAGDLRASHFVGMHALQGLPVVGAFLGKRAVVACCAAWLALTGAVFVQAMMGRPLV